MRRYFNKKIIVIGIILSLMSLNSFYLNIDVYGKNISILEKKYNINTTFNGNILYVGGHGPNNYTKIQNAIDNATDGDTIFVFSGTYLETVSINIIIDLIGEDKRTTIIDGNSSTSVVNVCTNGGSIQSFTIQNRGYNPKSGIVTTNSDNYHIINCNLTGHHDGVRFIDSSNNVVDHCEFYSNTEGAMMRNASYCTMNDSVVASIQTGIWIYDGSNNNYISNCTIYSINLTCWSYGMYFYNTSQNKAYRCKAFYNSDGFTFYSDASDNILEECEAYDNKDRGIVVGQGTNNKIINSLIYHNGYSSPGFYGPGISCYESYGTIIDGCTISDNEDSGVYLHWESNNNYIVNSIISENNDFGVFCDSSYGTNYIYHNNFIGNTRQARDDSANTRWDDGELGNYWDNYQGQDEDRDGIGDTPYDIPYEDSEDEYPLMFPYGEEPGIKIDTPEEGFLYIRNLQLGPFFTTVLLGNIHIKANAANYIYGIDRVEFYVDNILRKNDTIHPFEWTWRLSSHIKHRHTITVIVYDNMGESAHDDIALWRFF